MVKLKRIAMYAVAPMLILGCAAVTRPFMDDTARYLEYGIRPSSADALYRVARRLEDLGKVEEAIAMYREVIDKRPRHVEAHSQLGVSLAALGRLDEAIDTFRAAIALRADSAYLHNNLGYALLLAGADFEALESLQTAIGLDPTHQLAQHNLGVAQSRVAAMGRERRRAMVAAHAAGAAAGAVKVRAEHGSTLQVINHGAGGTQPNVELIKVAPSVFEIKLPGRPGAPQRPARPARVAEADGAVQSVATAANATEAHAPAQNVTGALHRSQATNATNVLSAEPALPQPKPFKLEVANGNGVQGMARRVAQYLERNGVKTERLTNDTTFNRPSTQIQFQPGNLAEAVRLSALMPFQVITTMQPELEKDSRMRMVLGKDLIAHTAHFNGGKRDTQIAAQPDVVAQR